MILNPGQLKHRYVVFKKEETIDAQGFKSTTLHEIVKGKCAITSTEYIENNRSTDKTLDTATVKVNCIMRYSDKIDEKCLISVNGKTWRIGNMVDIDFQNKYLKLVLTNG